MYVYTNVIYVYRLWDINMYIYIYNMDVASSCLFQLVEGKNEFKSLWHLAPLYHLQLSVRRTLA